MPTTNRIVDTTWTSLGTGPAAVGLNQGRMWFDFGDTAPATDHSGFLHTAQGQTRLVNFVRDQTIWARAVEAATAVVVVSGELATSIRDLSVNAFNTYSLLPDPTTQPVGTLAVVLNDPLDVLNGVHVVLGADDGNTGNYWRSAS